jgi:hypothetical protein
MVGIMTKSIHSYEPTRDDRITRAKWAIRFGIFYGLIAVILIGFVAVHEMQSQSDGVIASKSEAGHGTGRWEAGIAEAQP